MNQKENSNIENFFKGWFIGNFEPTLLSTNDFEVGVKNYIKNDYEEPHYHKIATEYTVILNGIAKMNDTKYMHGDIIIIKPGQITDFFAITDCITLVIKVPCVKNDKFFKNI